MARDQYNMASGQCFSLEFQIDNDPAWEWAKKVKNEMSEQIKLCREIAASIGPCGSSFLLGCALAMLTDRYSAEEVATTFNKLKTLSDATAVVQRKIDNITRSHVLLSQA